MPTPLADLAETDRFIGIDADNIVKEDFFGIEIDMDSIEILTLLVGRVRI